MNTRSAHEVLKCLFDEIVMEAQRSPKFAERLLQSMPEGAVVELRKPSARARKEKVDISYVNPMKICKDDGELALRSQIGQLTKSELGKLAKQHNLDLPPKALLKSAKKDEIVSGIVDAVLFRLRERAA